MTAGARSPRLSVLDPYIEQLREGRPAPAGVPLLSTLEGDELAIDDWAHAKLGDYLETGTPAGDDCARLVAQSVALLTKLGRDLGKIAGDDGEGGPSYGAQAEMMLNAALGGALVKGIQQRIDELLSAGRIAEARHLSRFHHIVRNAAFDARKRIDASEQRRMGKMLDGLAERTDAANGVGPTDGKPQLAPGQRAAREVAGRHRRRRAIRSPAAIRLPTRTEVLTFLLLTSASFWGLAVLLPAQLKVTPATLVRSELDGFDPPVVRFEARHPSVFADVEAQSWEDLDEDQRQEFVHALSERIGVRGFRAVFVRATDGRPLGRWIHTAGVELLKAVESPAADWGGPPAAGDRRRPSGNPAPAGGENVDSPE